MNVGILVLPLYVLAFSTGVPFPSYFFDFFLSFAVIVSFTYKREFKMISTHCYRVEGGFKTN